MKLLIAGSRSFDAPMHLPQLGRTMTNSLNILVGLGADVEVIHGGARGVDRAAGRWAEICNYPVTEYPADWQHYGKSAGYRRNAEMVAICDAAVIVWDGESKGTKHTIDLLTQAGKPYVLVVRKP